MQPGRRSSRNSSSHRSVYSSSSSRSHSSDCPGCNSSSSGSSGQRSTDKHTAAAVSLSAETVVCRCSGARQTFPFLRGTSLLHVRSLSFAETEQQHDYTEVMFLRAAAALSARPRRPRDAADRLPCCAAYTADERCCCAAASQQQWRRSIRRELCCAGCSRAAAERRSLGGLVLEKQQQQRASVNSCSRRSSS